VSGAGLNVTPPEPGRGIEATHNTPDPSLMYSRSKLQAMAAADEIDSAEVYWLYEHLRRSSHEANRLLDEFQEYIEVPITYGAILTKFIKPLMTIRADLAEYYWPDGCLLEDFAINEFEKAVLDTIRVIRTDWARLINAIQEYLETHQTKDAAGQSDRERAGEAFHLMFLKFAETLSSLANRPSFMTRHSQLAATLNIPPSGGRKRRKIRASQENLDTG
jgi:hypothetical protein